MILLEEQINYNSIKLSQIEKIDIDDLLGRDAVKPNEYLLKACIQNKTVLVTGAGGSIGSELCRQIICLNPKKIILLEQSEYFLYEIDREICDIKLNTNLNVDISTYMGSVGDESLIKHIFRNENIDRLNRVKGARYTFDVHKFVTACFPKRITRHADSQEYLNKIDHEKIEQEIKEHRQKGDK